MYRLKVVFAVIVAIVAVALAVADANPPTPKPFETLTNSIGMKLVLIPDGEFRMGSNDGLPADGPLHLVKITKPFYLQTTEVTQGQWESVMGTTPWRGKDYVKESGDYPATYVSWEDTQEFIKRLSAKERVQYRLPTEAQWEYGCRAGTTTAYSFGDAADRLGQYAWFEDNADSVDEKYGHRVGLKKPNRFGLYDMHGNVWEWCEDWYDGTFYGRSPNDDPVNTTKASHRVVRGGSWWYSAGHCRSWFRNARTPDLRYYYLGFRLARSSGE